MDVSADLELSQLLRELWRRKFPITAAAALFGIAALVAGLVTPRTYQCRSLVALPEVVKYTRNKDYSKVYTTLLTTAETRALLDFLATDLTSPDAPLLRKLSSIVLDEVRGSNSYFRMTVITRGDPQSAVALSLRIVDYLQTRPAIRDNIDAERRNLESYLRETEDAIKRTARLRGDGRTGSDQVGIEVGINQLKDTDWQLQAALSQLHSYRFVNGPTLDPLSAGPRIALNAAIYAVIGLILGIIAVAAQYSLVRPRRQ